MKKQLTTFCYALGLTIMASLTVLPSQVMAQESNRTARHELPNPERSAKEITDMMQKELNLTDKQYKKIYKLYLKEQKKMVEQIGQRPEGNFPPGNGERPQGPRPLMGGQHDGPGRPGERPDMKGPRPGDNSELEELREKNEKKLKKILTDEQYAKWQKTKPQKPSKEKPGK